MSGVSDGKEMPDEGHAVHYTAVQPGTPVYSSDGLAVGHVRAVLDNRKEHIFDGLVFEDRNGALRFADAPEVSRTAERAVTLGIDAEEAHRLEPPDKDQAKQVPKLRPKRLGRLLGGGRKRG